MRFFLIASVAAIITSSATLAAVPDGIWLSADGRVKVRVTDCRGSLCGTIVWLKQPIDPRTQRPRTDKLNPDVTKRDRPMLGLRVVQGLRPAGENKWVGPVYNADEGKVYNVNVTLDSPSKLSLKGCFLGLFCKSQIWTRAE